MTKAGKSEITRESIIAAIAGGARNMTQIAHAHGYIGNVSGDVTKVIRKQVPKIGEILVDAKAGKIPKADAQKPAAPVAPAVQVAQKKGVYRGLYGAVYSRAVAAGEVPVRDFIQKSVQEVASDPACARAVEKIRERNPDSDLVAQLTKAITFAVGVIRTPKHQSNMNRSRNASEVRGNMRIVAVE
jgi:hypothetical protein